MKNGILAIMSIVCVGLGAVAVFLRVTEDRKPPEIHFQENEITYVKGADYSELLLGVTATDNRDGDVTDSLVVESVYPNDDGVTATIIYVARDTSNNIGKANKLVKYQNGDMADSALDDTGESSQGNEENADNSSSGQQTSPAASSDAENVNQGNGQPAADGAPADINGDAEESENSDSETEEDEDNLPEGSPHIKLTTDRVTINRGDSINRISYVESITDDKDQRLSLWNKIQIAGDEFDRNTPGTYEQIYYVVDSDGNKSNEAKLTIVVQ